MAQALLTLSKDSKGDVDDAVARASRAGGVTDPSPVDDLGFMYGRSYADPDGHCWGVFWMDPAAAAGGAPERKG